VSSAVDLVRILPPENQALEDCPPTAQGLRWPIIDGTLSIAGFSPLPISCPLSDRQRRALGRKIRFRDDDPSRKEGAVKQEIHAEIERIACDPYERSGREEGKDLINWLTS
jgi:hypothetical protein